MLIVLEGCDGVGKSTLANNIAKVIGASVAHCTKNTANNYKFFCRLIMEGTHKNIVADRFMYGQFVYQTEEERMANGWLTVAERKDLERMLKHTNARVIHVVAPEDCVIQRLKNRDETIISGLTVKQTMQKFRDVMSESRCHVTELDASKFRWVVCDYA